MRARYQAVNFFQTQFAANHQIVIGSDGSLPLQDVPQIDDGKQFFLVLKPNTPVDQTVLPVFMDGNVVKYKGYNVPVTKQFFQFDTVQLTNVANYLNYLFEETDDFGKVVRKTLGDNTVTVYGGDINYNNIRASVASKDLTIPNGTWFIVFDHSTGDFEYLDGSQFTNFQGLYLAKIIISSQSIVLLEDKRHNLSVYSFDSSFFTTNAQGAISLKQGIITAQYIQNGAVDTNKIADDAVTQQKLAQDSVGKNQIQSNSVNSDELQDNSVGSNELQDDSVDSNHIKQDAVGDKEIDFSSFDTDDIQEGANNLYFTQQRVSNNSDVSANTAARHTHPNKPALDKIPSPSGAQDGKVIKTQNSSYVLADDVGGGGGGGGGNVAQGVNASFVGDGTTTTWNLPLAIGASSPLFVFGPSGNLMKEGDDYTVTNSTTIEFIHPPVNNAEYYIVYFAGGGGFATGATEEFIGDGTTTQYTLSQTPASSSTILVFNDSGIYYRQNEDYTYNAGQITFTHPPVQGAQITIVYFIADANNIGGEVNKMVNIGGSGLGLYKQKTNVTFELRKIRGDGGVNVYYDVNDPNVLVIDGNIVPGGGGESNLGNNLGTGTPVYAGKSGVVLNFKTFLDSKTIKYNTTQNDIKPYVDEDGLAPRLYRHFLFG